jgi:hypothetical protein
VESPSSWNWLTSALAVVGTQSIERAWSFLVHAGVLGRRHEVREALEIAIAAVDREGEITGPSRACRIASRLINSGQILFKSVTPDPDAQEAGAALAEFVAAGEPTAVPIAKPFNDVFCIHCGTKTKLDRQCIGCSKQPIDPVAFAVALGFSGATVTLCRLCGSSHRLESYCYYCGAAQ